MNDNTYRFTNERVDNPPLEIPKPVDTVQLQATDSTLYTASDTADFIVKHLWAANVTGSASTFSLFKVPSGGSASITNAVAYEVDIAANTTVKIDALIEDLLQPGFSIVARCGANDAVNVGGWGLDYIGRVR